jgi:hypothetical protein
MARTLTRHDSHVTVTRYCGPASLGPDRRMVEVTDRHTNTTVHMRYHDFVDMLAQVLPTLLEEGMDATESDHS